MAGKLRTLPGKVGKLAVAHRNLSITSVLSPVSRLCVTGRSSVAPEPGIRQQCGTCGEQEEQQHKYYVDLKKTAECRQCEQHKIERDQSEND